VPRESTDGYANGFIPDSALCPLWQAPGQKLRADAAAALNAMSKYHAATAGGPLCVTDSYRSYSEQVALYEPKPGLAATPGTSEHGWGKARRWTSAAASSGSARTLPSGCRTTPAGSGSSTRPGPSPTAAARSHGTRSSAARGAWRR